MTLSVAKKPIIYVSRDIERTLGMTPSSDYRIVTNRTPYAENIRHLYPDYVTLVESPEGLLGTYELLQRSETKEVLRQTNGVIVVFKNSLRIESLMTDSLWSTINPPAALSEKIENKVSQLNWLGDLQSELLPAHKLELVRNIVWEDKPIVIQWAHGHTGDGTLLIASKSELDALQDRFPERMARLSEFVKGPSFTVNVVVASNSILVGNISYQITGLAPFTFNRFSTVGNDWSIAGTLLSESEIESIRGMATLLGQKMQGEGWRGLFGLDVIRDDERNRICLIEINARQPASATFESELQTKNRAHGLGGMATFEAHIRALCGETVNEPLIVINDGAQIVQRRTKTLVADTDALATRLRDSGYVVIPYGNSAPNSDVLRIQSRKGIMESHNKWNERGKELVNIIETPNK